MENLLSQDFDEFAHDYYLKDGTFMRADDTYANAKSRLVDAEGEQVVAALEEMTWFADCWARIKRPTREPDGRVADAVGSLNRFGTQHLPPVEPQVTALRPCCKGSGMHRPPVGSC